MTKETKPKENALAVRQEFSLTPTTLNEAMEYAKLIATSDLAPKDYRNNPGNVLVAVQMGAEIGVSPMAAIQNIAIINGKPGVYGDLGKALLRRNGFDIQEADAEEIKKTGVARCTISHPRQQPVTRTFSLEDAKKAGLLGKAGPWSQYPNRQLSWRAFWFAARDAASDVLKGLRGAEEVRDYIEVERIDDEPAKPAIEMPRRLATPARPEHPAEPAPPPVAAEPPAPAPKPAPKPAPAKAAPAPAPPPPAKPAEVIDAEVVNDGIFDEVPADEEMDPPAEDLPGMPVSEVITKPRANKNPYYIIKTEGGYEGASFHASTADKVKVGSRIRVTKSHAGAYGDILDAFEVIQPNGEVVTVG